MKTNKSKLRILSILMAMLLLLGSLPVTAFAASYPATVNNGGMKVYRDARFKWFWAQVPAGTTVTVRATSGNIAQVAYRGRVGYAELDDMTAVTSGNNMVQGNATAKSAVAARATRVFQYASTRSRSVMIPKGTTMNVLAISGSCAKVERNGIIGYAYVNHLSFSGQANMGGAVSDQDRFEQAFKDQQAMATPVPTPVPTPAPTQAPVQTVPQTPSKEETAIEKVFNSGKYTNEELCYAFLVKVCGYNHAAACGVVANIKYESGFRPGAIGDSGKSMGICQWNSNRRTRLIDWCEQNGHDPETLLGQLYYLQYELTKCYPAVNTYLKGVENSEEGCYDAAYYFCYNFERPSNKASKSAERGNYAKNTTYKKFANL